MEAKQIHIKDGKKEYFICLDDILFVKADGNYCDIYLTQHTVYNTIRIQLGELWKLIETVQSANCHTLVRTGRSYIINIKYVQFADPKKKIITLHTDRAVELRDVPRETVKNLLTSLSKEKRKEVLRSEYIEQKVLTVPLEELNDEHLKSDGFEYVDLDLPSGTLWAAQNLCEDNEPQFYAWGELYPSIDYDGREYIHYDEDGKNAVRNPADPTTSVLNAEYDAAQKFRGGGWRLPTVEECMELVRVCILSWCQYKDYWGMLLTGRNGNRIFLPANGFMEERTINKFDKTCFYWTSNSSSQGRATALQLNEILTNPEMEEFATRDMDMYAGLSIRPVISKKDICEKENKKKRLLVVGDFFPDDLDLPMQFPDTKMDGWVIKDISLPLDPEQAMKLLTDVCERYKPDAIVGIRASCLFVKQMSAYKRFLWYPYDQPSDAMAREMEYQLEYELEKEEWTVTDEMIQQYKQLESQLSVQKVKGECWVISDIYGIDDHDDQYDTCKFVETEELEDASRWRSACMFPIVCEAVNGTYKDANGKPTPYGRKYNLY